MKVLKQIFWLSKQSKACQKSNEIYGSETLNINFKKTDIDTF